MTLLRHLDNDLRAVYDLLGDVPDDIRLMKVGEEYGEAVQAYIGIHGFNIRKGVTHTTDDLKKELCDVAITALIALRAHTIYPYDEFGARLSEIRARLETPPRPTDGLP